MNVQKITSIFGFLLTVCFAAQTYACYPPPTANITVVSPSTTVNVGQTISFTGYAYSEDTIVEYEWLFPPQAYCMQGDHTTNASCKFSPASPSGQPYVVKFRARGMVGGWSIYSTVNITVNPVSGLWYVSTTGSDSNDGRSATNEGGAVGPFRNIQTAINTAVDSQTIVIDEGTYYEQIDFKGKSITVQSEDPADWQVVQNTIIDAQMQGTTVINRGNETAHLKGITICNGFPEDDGLALHLEMDNSSEPAQDTSGKDRNGTPYNALWTSQGFNGGGMSFDGNGDYIAIQEYAGIVGTGSRTCSAWIKIGEANTTPYAVLSWGKGCASERKWVFGLYGGKVCVYTNSNGILGTKLVNDNYWHHIAAAFESDGSPILSDVKLYVDGALQTVTFSGNSKSPINTEVDDVLIGAYNYEPSLGAWYKGDLDEVKLYSRALSSEEIQQQVAFDPVAHWKLDEASGTQAEDSSGSDFHGTLTNFSPSPWTNGCIDGGLLFNGTSDYIMVAHDPVLNPQEFTISFWGRVDGNINNWRTPVCARSYDSSSNTFGYNIYASNINKWSFWTGTGVNGWDQLTGSNVELGRWTHIAASFLPITGPDINGIYTGIKRLYVDGIEVAVNMNGKYAVNVTAPLLLGKPDWSGGYFNGGMDDVRIYDRALGATEIYELSHAVLAHWKLDGNYNDTIGNHDGIPYGTPVDENGMLGDAIHLNGTDQTISVSSDSTLKPCLPLTLSSWIKLDELNSTGVIIQTDTWDTQFYGAYLRLVSDGTGKISIGYGDGIGSADSNRRSKVGTTVLQVGRWYHVVGVIRSALDMSIYINGVDDGGGYSGGGGNIAYSTGDLTIGSQNRASSFFKGALDDVCIYNYGLSKAEVQSVYNRRFIEGGGVKGHGASVNFSNCIVKDNVSETNGGGIEYCGGTIQNCLITNNTAAGYGGGLSACGDIINCTIADNSASLAGGLYDCNDLILNSIVWGNGIDSLEQCAIPHYSDIQYWNGGGIGNILYDPSFVNPQVGDYRLSLTSLCIDMGDPSSCYSNEPSPNGRRVNVGAQGNTSGATISTDTDGDGLTDSLEVVIGLDPNDMDTDNDGLTDGLGGYVHISDYSAGVDLDGDGYIDGEQDYGTTANDADSDDDNIIDGHEVFRGTNPLDVSNSSRVWYVDASSPSKNGKGIGWETAFKYLQDALLSPYLYPNDSIWVAKGVYYPDEGQSIAANDPNNPSKSFQLVNNVFVYGGFSGTEIELSQRNYFQHKTVLSGDIDQSDPNEGSPTGINSYHVVSGANTLLDGFTISHGWAGKDVQTGGGGLSCSSLLEVRHCVFEYNRADSGREGAAISVEAGSLKLVDTLVCGNFSTGDHIGGIYNRGYLEIVNCTIADNVGGGLGCDGSSATAKIENSIFRHNRMEPDDNTYLIREVVLANGAHAEIKYSNIEGGESHVIRDNLQQISWLSGNISDDPIFERSGRWYWKLADGNELTGDSSIQISDPINEPNQIVIYDFQSNTASMNKGINGVEEDEFVQEWLGYDPAEFSSERLMPLWEKESNKSTCNNSDDFYLWFTDNGTTGKGPKMTKAISWDCVNAEKGIFSLNDENFFPIDGMGLNDPNTTFCELTHNWFFTFQLHTKIIYVPGQTLFFKASDDLFVAIANRIVVDRGGYFNYTSGGTGPSRTTIVLKDGNVYVYEEPPANPYSLEGRTPTVTITELSLQPFESYEFDLFFAQRAPCSSVLVAEMTPGDIGMVPCFARGDYRLPIWNSPCVETGNPSTPADSNDLGDLACVLRFQDADVNSVAVIDMGAYEYQPPVAVDDLYYFTRFNQTLTISDPNAGLLANDFDPQQDELIAGLVSGIPSNIGILDVNSLGTFTFTPALDSETDAEFTYRAYDVHGGASNIAHVKIEVNDRPVAVGDEYVTNYKQSLGGNVIADGSPQDRDPDADQIYAVLVSSPNHGTVTLEADGAFLYEPNGVYIGIDSFTYKLIDEHGDESASTATVTIHRINAAPVASFTVNPTSQKFGRILDKARFDLDGSGSSDLENAIMSYSWKVDGQHISDASVVSVFLGYRESGHDIQLTVTDECGRSRTLGFALSTTVNRAPIANAGPNRTYPDNDNTGGETVSLDGSGSSDPDEDVLEYRWYEGIQQIATGQNPSVQLPVGIHAIRLLVKDIYGLTDECEVQIVVSSPGLGFPELDAGDPQEFTLPQASGEPNIVLIGTIIANPADQMVNYEWTVVSVPPGGQASITNSALLETAIILSDEIEGAYLFRLAGKNSTGDIIEEDLTSVKININAGSTTQTGPRVVINPPAGIDLRNIVVNTEITLSGLITDDGRPFGRLIGNWGHIHDDNYIGGLYFGTPQQISTGDGKNLQMQTTVRFTKAGDYILTLRGDDGDKTDQQAISVKVHSQTPPQVEAGGNKFAYIIYPSTFVDVPMSDAKVTDNEIPYGNVQRLWTVSGESTDPTAVNLNGQESFEKPTFRFTKEGSYKLILTASDPNVPTSPDPNDSVWIQVFKDLPQDPMTKKIYAGGSKVATGDPNGSQVFVRTFSTDDEWMTISSANDNGQWTAISAPNTNDNAILCLCESDTVLYIGTKGVEGKIYKHNGDLNWTAVNNWSSVEDDGAYVSFTVIAVYSLAEYNGELYAGTNIPNVLFKYEGGQQWSAIHVEGQDDGIQNLYVWKGKLFMNANNTDTFGYYDSESGR